MMRFFFLYRRIIREFLWDKLNQEKSLRIWNFVGKFLFFVFQGKRTGFSNIYIFARQFFFQCLSLNYLLCCTVLWEFLALFHAKVISQIKKKFQRFGVSRWLASGFTACSPRKLPFSVLQVSQANCHALLSFCAIFLNYLLEWHVCVSQKDFGVGQNLYQLTKFD